MILLLSMLIILAIIILGLGVYLILGDKSDNLKQEQNTIMEETEEKSISSLLHSESMISPIYSSNIVGLWQTYTDEERGYEIKYPDNASINELNSIYKSIDKDGMHITTSNGDIIIIYKLDLTKEMSKSQLSYSSNKCIFDSNDEDMKDYYSIRDIKIIDDIEFYHYTNWPDYIGAFCGMHSGCTYWDIYRVSNGIDCAEITYSRGTTSAPGIPTGQDSEVVEAIISTFRFLK